MGKRKSESMQAIGCIGFILIFLTSFGLNAKLVCPKFSEAEKLDRLEYFEPEGFSAQDKKHFIVLLPGLNYNPKASEQMISELLEHNVAVFNVFLYGARDENFEPSLLLPNQWIETVLKSFCMVDLLSSTQKAKWSILAYSMGGLYSEINLQKYSSSFTNLDKVMYIAPALNLNFSMATLLNLRKIMGRNWWIPNFNLENYRAKAFTSIAEYDEFATMYDLYQKMDKTVLMIPTILVKSPRDELINSDGVLKELHLHRETLFDIDLKKSKRGTVGKYHLLVDQQSLGPDWEHMQFQLKFLAQ
ncbi:MAG: hypothetical protein AB8E15_09380 [Bdellovibrionales bacterium]